MADSSTGGAVPDRFEENGTAHISRTVPMPGTISRQAAEGMAKTALATGPAPDGPAAPLWHWRDAMDALMKEQSARAAEVFPVDIEEIRIGNVRVHLVKPLEQPEETRGRVLINLHGGGFVMGSGALNEAIPVAHLAQIPVMAVDYALAPENPFPAGRDDVLTVYKAALAHHAPQHIGIYGSSAGGSLVAQAMAEIKKQGLSDPGALGMFTCAGDMTQLGDSAAIFSMIGLAGSLYAQPDSEASHWRAYAGSHDRADPALSPIRGDLSGWPPSLLQSGTRDMSLSGTTILHRALRKAGVAAELLVYEAMPHAHWYHIEWPEAREALDDQVRFFRDRLCG